MSYLPRKNFMFCLMQLSNNIEFYLKTSWQLDKYPKSKHCEIPLFFQCVNLNMHSLDRASFSSPLDRIPFSLGGGGNQMSF